MPEPGSVLLAAFPNQCTTRQEGNAKSISLRFWQREVKMGAYFSSEGRVQHVFPTRSISHRTRKDSSLLPWTVSLSPRTASACLWQGGLETHKPELRDQILCCCFLIAPHFSCGRGRQEVSELELPSAKAAEWCLSLCVCSGTPSLSPPLASGSNKSVLAGKGCSPKVLKDNSRVFCRSLLPFHLLHKENCFSGQEALCRDSCGHRRSPSLMTIVPVIAVTWGKWVFLAVSDFSVMHEGAFKLCPQLFFLIIQDWSPSFSSPGRIRKLSC